MPGEKVSLSQVLSGFKDPPSGKFNIVIKQTFRTVNVIYNVASPLTLWIDKSISFFII